MNSTDILAYVSDSAILCADHGAPFDDGSDEGAYPIFADGGSEWSAVEWCEDGADHGHSFCMSCGSDLDTTRGSQDADVSGNFSRCWSCGNESAYVDGAGFEWCVDGRWSSATESHKVEVYGVCVTYQTDLNGYTRVATIIDEAGTTMHRLRAFACYLEAHPAAHTVLVLSTGDTPDTAWNEAFAAATDHYVEWCEADEANGSVPWSEAEVVDDLVVVEVKTDQVWFTTKMP